MSILRKITVKTVCGKQAAPEDHKDLMTIIGIASGTRSGESNYGPWVSFTGHFEATNIETGEVFTSMQAFLPEPIQSALESRLTSGDVESVEVALKIGIRPSDAAIGYEYVTESLVEMANHDAIAHLRGVANKALDAPKASPKGKSARGSKKAA